MVPHVQGAAVAHGPDHRLARGDGLMQLVLPEILTDARGLSLPLPIAGLVMGLVLWALGWWSHRFWVVLVTTLAGGIFGLYEAPLWHMQPLAASLLLAVTAGMLALSLVQVGAFVVGGAVVLALLQALASAWNQPLLCFLLGGVLGLVLFRLMVMAFTSLGGAMLVAHCILCLCDQAGAINAVAYSQERWVLLNWLVGGAAVVGFILQLFLHRHHDYRRKQKSSKKEHSESRRDRDRDRERPSEHLLWKWFELPFRKAA